jgi:hypothetical protein
MNKTSNAARCNQKQQPRPGLVPAASLNPKKTNFAKRTRMSLKTITQTPAGTRQTRAFHLKNPSQTQAPAGRRSRRTPNPSLHIGTPGEPIKITYTQLLLHFQNFRPKLIIPAMLTSFTGRIITTLASVPVVVVIIGVVVTVPV